MKAERDKLKIAARLVTNTPGHKNHRGKGPFPSRKAAERVAAIAM